MCLTQATKITEVPARIRCWVIPLLSVLSKNLNQLSSIKRVRLSSLFLYFFFQTYLVQGLLDLHIIP